MLCFLKTAVVKEQEIMLTDSNDVAARLENLSWYLEINREKFASIDDAFLAGYKKALEDVVELMRTSRAEQSYN